jgi:predicted Zn-dependent protease
MKLSYKARYQKSESPKPFTVDVSFAREGISITYRDIQGNYNQQFWPKEEIKEVVSSVIIELQHEKEQLEITDQKAITEYKNIFKNRTQKYRSRTFTAKAALLIIASIFSLLTLSYIYLLPFVADKIAQHFPVDIEVSMGDKMYQSILETSEIDSLKTEFINHFFEQLHVQSDYPIRITVIKDTIVNAFAVPAGGIIVYDAMLTDMKNPEALAALLAHEYSHVALKHATRNVFRSLAGYLFLSIVLSDVNSIAAIVLNNSENLQTLKYSRTLEQEADASALLILKKNSISTNGMIQLFEQLKKNETVAISETFSTHPELDSRIAFVSTFTKENYYSAKQNDSLHFYFTKLKRE